MKNFFEINRTLVVKTRVIMLIMAVALMALPAMAQQEQWQSTSAMQSSGSAYSPQVTAVGATAAPSEATTTTASHAPGRPGTVKTGFITPGEGGSQSTESPIGEPWVLAIFATAFAAVIAVRRKRTLNR